MKLVMGVLCYARPIHTALTLAFAYANKADTTDLHFFYGIPRDGEHKSPALCSILQRLDTGGHGTLHYLPPAADRNTGGNVDNLMRELSRLEGYDCYFKIDDDVLIGPGTDEEMAELLLCDELQASRVYVLVGQAVREHMRGPKAFGWDCKLDKSVKRTIVCRSRGQSPMETFAAISYKMVPHLLHHNLQPTCENNAGTFGPYSQKLWATGAKAALVLFPHIVMQHIGLTCTTGLRENGSPRSWAPAKCWSPAGRIIEIPNFDFRVWERSHTRGTQKDVGMSALTHLYDETHSPEIKIIMEELDKYVPGVNDVSLPVGRPDDEDTPIRHKRRKRRVKVAGVL